jgi:anaerobic magnesium-protoporphyrin IX monomethyl ester cyclase
MPDILLTHGYFLAEDEKEQQIMKPYPPLGLLYLSAYLRGVGFQIEIFDPTFSARPELTARLDQEGGGVLGIYTTLSTRPQVIWIISQAKSRGWEVVLGGPESANYPAEYLAHGADVIVTGEGEETLSELLPALARQGPHRLHDLYGLAFKDEDGQIIATLPRPQIADLDALPWPDRLQIDMQQYLEAWRRHHGQSSVHLITARGCPYQCQWCSHAVFGYSHRQRHFRDCAAEVQQIYETYHPDQLWYADDVFTMNHRWLYAFAAELKRRQLKVPFETISRADRMLKEEVIRTLAEMGCFRIWLGSESGSPRILDAMRRGITPEQVQWVVRTAQRHGLQVGLFLMWGYEGEELGDIEATIDHVTKANPDIFFTTVVYPIKNTPYYELVADRLLLPEDWAAASDRDIKIKGRHSRRYYKYADQWLRNEVEACRLEAEAQADAAWKRQAAQEARAALLACCEEVEA